jgi:hypothetical protein
VPRRTLRALLLLGPEHRHRRLVLHVTPDGLYANCKCFDIPYGVYFVDINGILNHSVYEATIAQCGVDGSQCGAINSAPVCNSVNQGNLIPGAQLFSTFSFDCVPTNGIGQTNCGQAPYAGCMTAPCRETDSQAGIVDCSCPVFDGPYQVGQNAQICSLGDNLVWSAAYTPSTSCMGAPLASRNADATSEITLAPSKIITLASTVPLAPATAGVAMPAAVPSPPTCLPDAPGGVGCPLFVPGTTVLPPNSGVDCAKVCDEYNSCRPKPGLEVGYTCDATLCTDECNDRDLVGNACGGLSKCDISEIVKAETAASCSCCASQLCECASNGKTNTAIAGAEPGSAQPRHYAAMRHQRHALRDSVMRRFTLSVNGSLSNLTGRCDPTSGTESPHLDDTPESRRRRRGPRWSARP